MAAGESAPRGDPSRSSLGAVVPARPRDTSEILTRGNSPRCLRLLLAQRRLYRSAKRYAVARLSGIALFAFAAPMNVIENAPFKLVDRSEEE